MAIGTRGCVAVGSEVDVGVRSGVDVLVIPGVGLLDPLVEEVGTDVGVTPKLGGGIGPRANVGLDAVGGGTNIGFVDSSGGAMAAGDGSPTWSNTALVTAASGAVERAGTSVGSFLGEHPAETIDNETVTTATMNIWIPNLIRHYLYWVENTLP